MSVCMIDTHVAVALYSGMLSGYSAKAKRVLDVEPLSLSPAVVLELELLFEIGRIRVDSLEITNTLTKDFGVRIANDRFADVAQSAVKINFTRDPFDRWICAHADYLKAPLLSLDRRIQAHYGRAFG
jgi:PIN domain nuclease of toxin-antitoxin system